MVAATLNAAGTHRTFGNWPAGGPGGQAKARQGEHVAGQPDRCAAIRARADCVR